MEMMWKEELLCLVDAVIFETPEQEEVSSERAWRERSKEEETASAVSEEETRVVYSQYRKKDHGDYQKTWVVVGTRQDHLCKALGT